MNKRRKEKLDQRARQYANTRLASNDRWERGFFGYQDGYRAAMADMRKTVKRAEKVAETGNFHGTLHQHILRYVRIFLLPLR